MKKVLMATMLSLSVHVFAQTSGPVHQNVFVSAQCEGEIDHVKTTASIGQPSGDTNPWWQSASLMYFSKKVSGQFNIRKSSPSRFVLWNTKEFNIIFDRASLFSDVAAMATIVKKGSKIGELSCEVHWTDSIPAEYKVVTTHDSKRL